jgi:hypothetical protein
MNPRFRGKLYQLEGGPAVSSHDRVYLSFQPEEEFRSFTLVGCWPAVDGIQSEDVADSSAGGGVELGLGLAPVEDFFVCVVGKSGFV